MIDDEEIIGELQTQSMIFTLSGTYKESNNEVEIELDASNANNYVNIKYSSQNSVETEIKYEIESMINGVEQIKEFRSKYQTKIHEFRVRTHLNYLRWPRPLILSLLSEKDKQEYGDLWLDYIHANKLTEKKHPSETFYLNDENSSLIRVMVFRYL